MMRIKQTVLSGVLIFLTSFVSSQVPDTTYAREIINRLAAENMHGRGYVNNGDHLASAYIQDVFKENKLTPFSPNYMQSFTFPVNTFPGALYFKMSAREKNSKVKRSFDGKPAVNMLFGSGSSEINRTYTVVVFDSTYAVSESAFHEFKHLIKSAPSALVLVDDRTVLDKGKLEYFKKVKANCFETAGVIEFTKKLTHSVSQKVSSYITIKLLTDSFQLDIANLKNIEAKVVIESKFLPEQFIQILLLFLQHTTIILGSWVKQFISLEQMTMRVDAPCC